MQEIYARLILYNYCEIIAMNVVIHQKDTKHVYQMNYTIAKHPRKRQKAGRDKGSSISA